MEGNRQETEKWADMAKGMIAAGDFQGAKQLLGRMASLSPGAKELQQLLAVVEVHIRAQVRVGQDYDWYAILQVDRDASESAIRKQYKKLALHLHPDKNQLVGAEAAFKIVGQAFQVLSDAEKRAKYDSLRPPSSMLFPAVCPNCKSVHQLFSTLFLKIVSCTLCRTSFLATSVPQQHQQQQQQARPQQTQRQQQQARPKRQARPQQQKQQARPPQQQPQARPPQQQPQARPPQQQPYQSQQQQQRSQWFERFFPNGSGSTVNPAAEQLFNKYQREAKQAQQNSDVEENRDTKVEERKVEESRDTKVEETKVEESRDTKAEESKMEENEEIKVEENGEATPEVKVEGGGDSKSKVEEKREADVEIRSGVKMGDPEPSLGEQKETRPRKRRRMVADEDDDDDENFSGVQQAAATPRRSVRNRNKVCYSKFETIESDEELPNEAGGNSAAASDAPAENTNTVEADVDSEPPKENGDGIHVVDNVFFDFDKQRLEGLGEGQIWALYDDLDAMPRWYARVFEVSGEQETLKVKWLESVQKSSHCPGCGEFKVQRRKVKQTFAALSHRIEPTSANSSSVSIFPRQNEVWCVFQNWKESWLTTESDPYEYSLVEIVRDEPGQGWNVVMLKRLAQYPTVFTSCSSSFTFIDAKDFYRFSHKVPAFKLLDNESADLPPGCWELDGGAIPGMLVNDGEERKQL